MKLVPRRKYFFGFGILIFLFSFFSSVQSSNTATVTLFGPKIFTRLAGQSLPDNITVNAPNLARILNGSWTLKLNNGDDIRTRISSGQIAWNGQALIVPSDLNKQVVSIERPILLHASNNLNVSLKSEPGAFVTLTVVGNVELPPPVQLDPLVTPTSDPQQKIQGKAEPGTTVELSLNNQTLSATADATTGVFSLNVTLQEGNNLISVREKDSLGLFSAPVTVTLVLSTGPKAVIVGEVFNSATEQPLAGAQVTSLDNPGSAFTDAQGKFVYKMGTGGTFRIRITKEGFTFAQRIVAVEIGQEATVGKIFLSVRDTKITQIDSAGGIHQNSTGTIQVEIPPAATAVPIAVQTTQYEKERELPGLLPDTSFFTYAAEFEPDGATFSKPVTIRIANSLGFQPGTSIPVGVWNQQKLVWEHAAVATVTADGKWAEYQMEHFSPHDVNLPAQIPGVVGFPDLIASQSSTNTTKQSFDCVGSAVAKQSGELIQTYQTPAYRSLGRDRTIELLYNSATTGGMLPLSLNRGFDNFSNSVLPKEIRIDLNFAGQEKTIHYQGSAGTIRAGTLFSTLDGSGKSMGSGVYPYTAKISHGYDGATFGSTTCFGCDVQTATNVSFPGRLFFATQVEGKALVENEQGSSFGNGWRLSNVQRIVSSSNGDVLLMEQGGGKLLFESGMMLETIAGTGQAGFSGEGLLATEAKLFRPTDLAFSPAGELTFADAGNQRIRKITSDGFLVTIAGGGSDATSDNIPATQALLGEVTGISFDSAGNLYLVETDRARVRMVNVNGLIQTVFQGTCTTTNCRLAPDNGFVDVAVDGEGNLLLTDVATHRIKKVTPSGTPTDLAGQGPLFLYGDRPLSQGIRLSFPNGISVNNKGEILFVNAASNLPFAGVWRLDMNNVLKRVAGTFEMTGYAGEGIEARQAHIADPLYVVEDTLGNIYFSETGVGVRKVDTRGMLTTLAGRPEGTTSPSQNFQAIGGARVIAVDAQGVAVSPAGEVVFADRSASVIRRVIPFGIGQAREFSPPPGEFSRLIQNADGTYVRTYKNGGEARFSADGLQTASIDRNGNTTTYEYDQAGELIRITDPVGLVTNLFYSGGKLSQVEDPSGKTTRFEMNDKGDLVRIISPAGEQMNFTYDASHRMISKVDARGEETGYIFSEKGGVSQIHHPSGEIKNLRAFLSEGVIANPGDNLNPAVLVQNTPQKLTDGRGGVATSQLDEHGLETEVVDPLGRVTKISRNGSHLPTSITRPDRSLVQLSYDVNSNPTVLQVISSSGSPQSRFTYEPKFNQVTSVTDPNNKITFFEYDTRGNLIKTTNPLGEVTQAFYNSLGLMTSIKDALGRVSSLNYDSKGNLANTTDPLGNTTSFSYDGAGNIISTTDAEGKTTQFTYDAQNRLTTAKDSSGGVTTYSYAQSGCGCAGGDLVTAITDPMSNTTQFAYDAVGNLIATIDPKGNVETREYDLNRNLTTIVDRNGSRITFAYDSANQLVQVSKPEETVSFAHNLLGSITAAGNANTSLTLSYDGLNRLIKVLTSHVPGAGVEYVYDAAGNVVQTKGPQGTILTSPDPLNRVSQVQVGAGITFDKFFMSYDAVGQRTSNFHQLTELQENRTYDAAYRLTQWINKKGFSSSAPVLSKFDYTYDKAGNRVRTADPFGTHNYSYDSLYRLLGVDNPLEAFSYDKVGNRLSSVELKENSLDPQTPIQVPVAYTYNEDNQLTAMTKDGQPFASFTYDKNGNVLTKIVGTETTTYSWDSENRLTKIQTPTQTVEFAYDPFGRRLEKKTGTKVTRYVYDREDIVAEYDGSNVLQASYIHGPGVDEPLQMKRGGVTYFYQRDALGSIASLSDGSGNKLRTYRYDSFGRVIAETGTVENPYIYTGRERDSETGLYYYRARYYDPQVGRFLNEDPIGFGSGDTNFYAYVFNNPTNFIDPSGFGILPAAEMGPGAGVTVNRLHFDGNRIYWEDDAGGVIRKYGATSGPFGKGRLPGGSYTGQNLKQRFKKRGMVCPSGGWSLDLEPNFPTQRKYLRIHPDQPPEGTEGCIGVDCRESGQFYRDLKKYFNSGENSIPVEVRY